MEHEFWHQRWDQNQIGFHEGRPNAHLVAHFSALGLRPGGRVFVPLCGKTQDIGWLLDRGCCVAGAELSGIAIDQLFTELNVEPEITKMGALERYSAPNIDIFVGDIFDLAKPRLGPVDAVFDRAALVALPDGMRHRYSQHLMALTDHAPQLLITFHYDQSVMPGPPFSIPFEEVQRHYAADFKINLLAEAEVNGGLKGVCPANETIWHLTRRTS